MKILPVVFRWREVEVTDADGVVERVEAMVPDVRYRRVAKRQYVGGEDYPLVVLEVRSRASHSAYFASVNEAYKNLPETVQERWLNATHMRKWILIELGWYNEKEVEFDTKKDAMRLATMYRSWDSSLPVNERDYARIKVVGRPAVKKPKVIIRIAKSQSASSMEKAAFEESKKAVLDYLEDALGVKRGELRKNAGRAA